MKKTLKVNEKLLPFLTKPQPIKVVVGGRGSGKSIGLADMAVVKMDQQRIDVYCLREFQQTVADSIHRTMERSISNRLELDGWDVQENKILSPWGNRTTYKGAERNTNNIQGAEDYLLSMFSEAHTASQASIDKLLPTILRKSGAQCWFDANPQSSADPFSKRFINPYIHELRTKGFYEDDLHYIVMVNWRDNPWWNEEQEALRAWDEENLSRAKYRWIWEGDFNDEVDDSIITAEWFDACIDAHKNPKLEKMFKPVGSKVAAHDLSGQGKDAKSYVLRHGSIIKKVKLKTTGDVDDGFDWALDNALADNADQFVWDGDGMGANKRQVSIALNGTRCDYHMFRGSLSGVGQDNAGRVYMPTNDGGETKLYEEEFKNNRAQYYFDLATRCENTYKCVVKGEYIDPDEMISFDSDGIEDMQGLRSEVCRIPRKHNANNIKQILNKQEMKKMGIDSPNAADGVMMSLWSPPVKKKRKKMPKPKLSVA